jgi:hypothetical protein
MGQAGRANQHVVGFKNQQAGGDQIVPEAPDLWA